MRLRQCTHCGGHFHFCCRQPLSRIPMNEFKAIADELRLINLQLKQGSEHADDAVARVATLAQEIKNHGILTSRILLSDSLQASDLRENGDSSSKCVAQAALLIPEGFGVCRWTTID